MNRHPQIRSKCQRGFTLVETLVALSLTLIVATAIYALYLSQQETYTINSERMALQADLRRAMSVITSQMRTAGFDPTEFAGAGVVSARADYLYFTQDNNFRTDDDAGDNLNPPNGSLTNASEHVAFCRYLSDGDWVLGMHSGDTADGSCSGTGAAAPATPGDSSHNPMASGITSLQFRYFDGDGGELAPDAGSGEVSTPARIRQVQITLEGRFTYKGTEYKRSLTETVYLRNMRS